MAAQRAAAAKIPPRHAKSLVCPALAYRLVENAHGEKPTRQAKQLHSFYRSEISAIFVLLHTHYSSHAVVPPFRPTSHLTLLATLFILEFHLTNGMLRLFSFV